MTEWVIGRRGELEAIERLLGRLAGGPAVLVLEGEAGIGKTTLVRAGTEAARRQGARVLACAATASETRLTYAALADLLRTVDVEALACLPAPQRDALDAALLRGGPAGLRVDRHAVATAALSVFEALAAQDAVVIAIDDLQWLDRASAQVISFCVRRLTGGVGLIASRRTGVHAPGPVAIAGLRDPDRIEVRRLDPLTPGEVRRLLREYAHEPPERRWIARIEKASGGNPFYALELARAARADGRAWDALPLPASLEEVVGARVAELGPDVEETLLAVAALAEPTVELLERALGAGARRRLEVAEDRGTVELIGSRVRFTHPLLGSGIYARAGPGRRRAMHGRLSRAVADVEEQARHLALAGAVAEAIPALDRAARHVRSRGAPQAAGELLELALRLGGGQELRVRAAKHHFDAGDPRRARTLLEEAVAALPAGDTRTQALLLLAEIRYKDDSLPAAREILERARVEAGANDRLRVMIDLRLTFTLFNLGRLDRAAAVVRPALARAERLDEPALLAQALAVSVMVEFSLGGGVDERRLQRAIALEDLDPDAANEFLPSLIASFVFMWTDRFAAARERLEVLSASHEARGDEHAIAWVLGFVRPWLECWAGDLAAASRAVDDGVERLLALETTVGRALALAARARVDAYAGRVDAAVRGAEEALALFEGAGAPGFTGWTLTTLGFVELSLGRHEAAAARLGPAAVGVVSSGLPEPAAGGMLLAGDAAEALIMVGRSDEAETLVELLEQRGAALDRTWAIAVGARCRGLLLAARGDVAAAEEALERAVVAHDRLPMPIERGRTLLALGRIRRRRRRRIAAKEALEAALDIFETVGSPRWAEQASAEIACLGLHAGASDALTPAEERVAVLAASGLTNQEVATSLIVSAKTVEAQLARAYRKLGIRSRAELGARMSAGHSGGAPRPP